MELYSPPYTITNQMLSLVADISEKLGKVSISNSLEAKPHLRRNNRIKSIHSSLKIEANSLSLGQVRDVIDGHLVLGEQKEIQEVKNAYAAYERLPNIDPYQLSQLKELHGVMTKYVVEESGVFRSEEEGVLNGDQCIFMAPPAKFVPRLMDDLFSWMSKAKNELHPLILSAIFHYEFVFIHPFSDGNGRMARLWHTALLSQWKPIFEYIPLESQIEKFQQEYYAAIAACHTEGSSNVFIEFMLEQIDKVLDEIAAQLIREESELSIYVEKLLSVMEQDVPYNATALLGKLGLKSRNTLRNHYLTPAIEQGLVTMTIPEKPNSRNQRYKRM